MITDGDEAATDVKKWKTAEVAGTADRDKLLDDLFTNYKVDNYPENSTVNFGLAILNADLVILFLLSSLLWIWVLISMESQI